MIPKRKQCFCGILIRGDEVFCTYHLGILSPQQQSFQIREKITGIHDRIKNLQNQKAWLELKLKETQEKMKSPKRSIANWNPI